MRTTTCLFRAAILALILLAGNGTARADILYAVDGGGSLGSASTLYDANTAQTLSLHAIHQVTPNNDPRWLGATTVQIAGLAFDQHTGVLYGAAIVNNTTGYLLTFNTSTAVASIVGALGLSPSNTDVTALSFSPSGTLYGYVKQGSHPDSLYTINTVFNSANNTPAGHANFVGASGIGSTGDGLAVDPSGTTIYFAGHGTGNDGTTGEFDTLSESTGHATRVGTFSGGTYDMVKGMAFDGSGRLYAIDFSSATNSNHPSDLATINLTPGHNFGHITDVATEPNGLVALAFDDTAAAAPEPGTLALVTTAALALIGYQGMRRRLF